METVLCSTCASMFTGEKHAQTAPGIDIRTTPHHESLDDLLRGVDVGCVLCNWMPRHIVSDMGRLQSLKSFRSQRFLIDYGFPREVRFAISLEGEHGKTTKSVVFDMLPLSPDIHAQDMFPPVAAYANSETTMQLLRRWLHDCQKNHKQCSQRAAGDPSELPTRLLDVGVPEGPDMVWLRCTASDFSPAPGGGEYLTLSHIWGRAPFLQLNAQTADELAAGMPSARLPRTFREAVLVARQLGIRHLWIDSLCIRQDLQADWLREAPNMQRVYSHAVLNLVAGHAVGPHDGGSGLLHDVRDPRAAAAVTVRAAWDGLPATDYVLWDGGAFEADFARARATQRGWIFQERLLAPRLLHFGRLQVYWRCLERFACESWPGGVSDDGGGVVRYGQDLDLFQRPAAAPDQNSGPAHAALWEQLSAAYTACRLTKPEDKLFALSGVAKAFQQRTQSRYLAGLWRLELARLLCWRRKTVPVISVRPHYRAPSWSWASIDDPIVYMRPAGARRLADLVEIVDAHTETAGPDETVQIEGGRLTVRGRLHALRVTNSGRTVIRYEMDGKHRGRGDKTMVMDVSLGETKLEDLELWFLPVELYRLASDRVYHLVDGLLLTRSGEAASGCDPCEYQRVGYFYEYHEAVRDAGRFGLYVTEAESPQLRRDSEGLVTLEIV